MLEKPPQDAVTLPLAFLRRTLSNRAIDRLRAEQVRLAHASTGVICPSNDDWDGQKPLEVEEQLPAQPAIIDALPARQRQVFLLHRIHDMPQREIAQELGISTNMVIQQWEPVWRAGAC